MTFRALVLSLAVLAATPAAAAAPAPSVQFGEIQMRLFYKASGRLSDDILHRPDAFAAWNTVIGEGSAEEPADDVLVIVPILNGPDGAGGEAFADVPVSVRALDGKGKVLGSRTIGAVLTGAGGRDHVALWLRDVTCVGPLRIEAVMGAQKKQARIAFNCGE